LRDWRGSRVGRRSLVALLGFVLVACSSPSTNQPQATGSSAAVGNPSAQPSGATSIPNASAPPEQATAQALIEAAHAAGRIDLVTSLVYRAEALIGLPGLPPEFAGATPAFEDNGLFAAILDLLPTLSPADQARLKPFVVRPTDPASIFAGGAAAVTGDSATLTSYSRPSAGRPTTNDVNECRNWVDSGPASPHFKVWACVTANPADDQAVVSGVAATMDDLWARMTPPVPNGMGQPLPDGRSANPGPEFGGDQRIDVYVLALTESVFREGDQRSISDGAALEVPSEPFTGKTASGFMLVNRGRLTNPDFRNDLIHEFFHILEMAHNYRAMVNSAGQLQWFEDASATWAESYFGQSVVVHGWFHDFQASPLSLASSDGDHPQQAYIWPIFMEQEVGASAIFTTWQQIEGVGKADFDGVNAVINAQLPFKDHFRDFAVRNLNQDVLGQVTAPGPEKRYQQLVPSIPGTYWPTIDDNTVSSDTTTSWTPTSMPALTARYLHLSDSAPGGNVTLDLSGLTPADSLDADVLVHVKDHWERRQVDGTQFTYCRDVPADDIDQLYLVVSNHSDDPSSIISGAVTIKAGPCNGWQGTMSTDVSWTYSHGQQTGHASTMFTGIWVQDEDPSKYVDCLLSGAANPQPGTDCPLIYKPIGTIAWSFEAHCTTGDDARSGSIAAATGFPVPETDWQQQALYLLKTPDGQHFQYWGEGVLPTRPADEGTCNAGDAIAGPAPEFFTILQDAATRPATTSSCFGTSWTIDATASAISGSCHYRTAAGEYDQGWTWNLQKVGNPTAPPG
jgi:hypothetical protein